jgi:hypothetical protein
MSYDKVIKILYVFLYGCKSDADVRKKVKSMS